MNKYNNFNSSDSESSDSSYSDSFDSLDMDHYIIRPGYSSKSYYTSSDTQSNYDNKDLLKLCDDDNSSLLESTSSIIDKSSRFNNSSLLESTSSIIDKSSRFNNSSLLESSSFLGDTSSMVDTTSFDLLSSLIDNDNSKDKSKTPHNSPILNKVKKFNIKFSDKKHHPWEHYNTTDNSIYINNKNGPLVHLYRNFTYIFNVESDDSSNSFVLTSSPVGGPDSLPINSSVPAISKGCFSLCIDNKIPRYLFYQSANYKYQGGIILVHD